MRLKEHETTAIARPISRQVARRPWLHRVIRDFTDPVLLFGTLAAVVRVRWTYMRLVKAGLIQMPADPVAAHAAAQKRAEEAVRRAAPAADEAAAPAPAPTPSTEQAPAPAAAAAQTAGQHLTLVRAHQPHVDVTLRSALDQLQDATG